MTEGEWLQIQSARSMLIDAGGRLVIPVTPRRLRLFVCACCRDWWSSLPPRQRRRVETAERFVDGEATRGELLAGRSVVPPGFSSRGTLDHYVWIATYPPEQMVAQAPDREGELSREYLSELMAVLSLPFAAGYFRDIFGNPFRSPVVDSGWLTTNVLDLARAIYDELAFDRMPILSDALMDAGCDNTDILGHCRSEGPHVRGCWVVDLVLGKG